ncbi:uncharacterized protein LOC119604580 isoform X1 [Lucilia sericata]|uniref:uncharacterized protein LOC119604580 isoform X1 n=1 Tax=Lucilia sericata TaxID=13632 RepID=UPI0018A7EEF6|nr:uncharacterized protein LOC119604580 isoform X1 [Lucilia sericata]
MLTGPKVNSAMGLQATTATKRKHDLTFDSKDANTYTNCPPPIKTSKWSLNNNNYIDAVGEQKAAINGTKTNSHNNNNNNENKSCDISCGTLSYSLRNGKEVSRTKVTTPKPVLNAIVANIPVAGEVDATTPLPPTSSSPVPEDSIAKLEVVASVPWTTAPEPVDCISKLQAVAVPSDPWGSISTRSTLATTLLSADELDDDDDDFEDDYEEEESIIPTYCPLRYHTFPSANSSTSPSNHQTQRMPSGFTTSQSYGSRPNYYSEPFPQQNCSRTGSPQHLRVGNGFAWPNGNNSGFYASPESAYTSPQHQQQTASQQHQPQAQQQTIRCAENGKSYLELGCSSPIQNVTNNTVPASSPTPFVGLHVAAPAPHETRLPLKRCCDGRGSWCGSNKSCYKDIRLKIRNLSMFKLSRFRQVSEQSLYRSVLICNTLKRIDREIEAEAKELHQAAAQVAQQHHNHINHTTTAHHQPQSQYHHHLHSHIQIQSPLPSHNNSNNGHHHQLPQQQQHHSQQPMLHPQHQDYMPVPNCGRLGGNVEYQNHQQQQSAAQQNFHHHLYQNERMETSPFQNSLQKPAPSSQFVHNQSSNTCSGSVTTTLHPYDHYPFRETHSGRATPFPSQPVISLPPASASASTSTSSSQVQSSVTSPAINTTTVSTATSIASDADSGYADDDSTRSINWSSVLSLSSQSALDPLNNNDLFSILPPANPATAVPVSIPASSSTTNGSETNSSSSMAVAISGTFTTVQSSSSASPAATSSLCNTSTIPPSATTTATFTTLSTISSATHSLTSSYVSSMSSNSASASSTWEYGFLDMEFGLGTEFTELAPSCKLSADDFGFKNSLTPVTVTRYDNELEQPAHIMVGS